MSNDTIKNAVIPLDALAPHPRNYNLHPEAQIGKLRASLARFGQVRSVVVQEGAPGKYLIVAGHCLAEAAKLQGFPELRADIIPASWSAEQVEGYLVADNLTQRDSVADDTILAQLLQEQLDAGYDLMTLGSDEDELADLLKKTEVPSLDDLTEEYGDEPDDEDFWPVIRLKVSQETKERLESLMDAAGSGTDDTKLRKILDAVDTAAME